MYNFFPIVTSVYMCFSRHLKLIRKRKFRGEVTFSTFLMGKLSTEERVQFYYTRDL